MKAGRGETRGHRGIPEMNQGQQKGEEKDPCVHERTAPGGGRRTRRRRSGGGDLLQSLLGGEENPGLPE